MVRDAIKPDVTMFLHYETIEEKGKEIVVVDIQRGTDRPYYLAKKGMRPEGVYVRQGYSSVPATDAAIRRMIKETDGNRFESMRSLNQELTFEAVKKEFELRMEKIMKAYEDTGEKPEIQTTKNAFKIILPNVNAKYMSENSSVWTTKTDINAISEEAVSLSEAEEKILEYVREHGVITKNDVISLLEVSASTASRTLRKMVKNNLLKQNGKARRTNYTIIK